MALRLNLLLATIGAAALAASAASATSIGWT
jgi:hypothetical protein